VPFGAREAFHEHRLEPSLCGSWCSFDRGVRLCDLHFYGRDVLANSAGMRAQLIIAVPALQAPVSNPGFERPRTQP